MLIGSCTDSGSTPGFGRNYLIVGFDMEWVVDSPCFPDSLSRLLLSSQTFEHKDDTGTAAIPDPTLPLWSPLSSSRHSADILSPCSPPGLTGRCTASNVGRGREMGATLLGHA